MKFSDIKIGTKLYIGFGAIVVILVLLITVAYVNFSRFSEANLRNIQSYEALEQTQGLLESLINIQTGERGFAFTGQESFLDPLNAGKKSFAERITKIKGLTADSPKQQERLAKLEADQQKWMKVAIDPVLKLRKGVTAGTIQLDSLVMFEQTGRGERAMNEMRVMIAEFRAAEEDLLVKRSWDVANLQKLTNTILIGGGVIAVLLAAVEEPDRVQQLLDVQHHTSSPFPHGIGSMKISSAAGLARPTRPSWHTATMSRGNAGLAFGICVAHEAISSRISSIARVFGFMLGSFAS